MSSIGFIFADGKVEKTLAVISMHLFRHAGFSSTCTSPSENCQTVSVLRILDVTSLETFKVSQDQALGNLM